MATTTEHNYGYQEYLADCADAEYMPDPLTNAFLLDKRKEAAEEAYRSFRVKRKQAYADIDALFARTFPAIYRPPQQTLPKGLEQQCILADIARVVIVKKCPNAGIVFDRLEFLGKVKDGYEVSISETTLMEWTGLKRRTVQVHLKALARCGVIERISGGGKEGVISRYRLYGPRMMETAQKITIPDNLFGGKKWKSLLETIA